MKQLIGKRNLIYVGVYLDYGLNDIYDKNKGKDPVEYHEEIPVAFQHNSVYDSSLARDMRLVSYGLKLRFAMR